MFRKALVMAAVLIVLEFCVANSSAARTISPRNPYRSFNISGINYGSMKWENSRRSRSNYRSHMSRSSFRR